VLCSTCMTHCSTDLCVDSFSKQRLHARMCDVLHLHQVAEFYPRNCSCNPCMCCSCVGNCRGNARATHLSSPLEDL
jgi:hypothetical protein